MKYLKVIAFTHKHTSLKNLGKLIINEELLLSTLQLIKTKFNIFEIFYLSTCNRVEFVFTSDEAINQAYITRFIGSIYPQLDNELVRTIAEQASIYTNNDALNHLLRVSC